MITEPLVMKKRILLIEGAHSDPIQTASLDNADMLFA